MAKNPSSESVDETAFQALEDALKINFNDEQSRPRSVPHASEARVSDTTKPRQTQYQDDAAESYRSAATETAAKSPTFQPANDAGKRSSTAILRTLEGGAMRSSIRNAVIVSILWAVGGIALGQMIYGNQALADHFGRRRTRRTRHRRARRLHPHPDHAVLRIRDHDGPRSGPEDRRPLDGRGCASPVRSGNRRIRTDHERRPGRASRSLCNERRHRAHHRPCRRTRNARAFGSECAGAELYRQRTARSRPCPRTRRRTGRDRQPRRAHPLVDRRRP